MRSKFAPPPAHPRYIVLSATSEEVMRGLDESARTLRTSFAPQSRPPTNFARGSRVQAGGRTYADVIGAPRAGSGATQGGGHPTGRRQQYQTPPSNPPRHPPPPPPTGQQWRHTQTAPPPPPTLLQATQPPPAAILPTTTTIAGPPPPPPSGLTQAEIWFLKGLRAGNGGAVGGGGWAPPGFGNNTAASATAQLAQVMGVPPSGYGQNLWGVL